MKIQKIKFIKYKHFAENHELIFEENGKIPDITFLVGDNGSGKTAVLDAIYALHDHSSIKEEFQIDYFIQLSSDEMRLVGTKNNEIVIHFNISPTSHNKYISESSGTTLPFNSFDTVKKILFSTVETNFTETNFTNVTARSIDDSILPKEKSLNLSIEIPQLLIDIKNADSNELSDYVLLHPNEKYKDKPSNIASRLKRFTSTFHEMYNGSKTFKEIRDKNGNKNIVFVDKLNREVSLNQLSTGEKQIIYRIGYLLKNLGTISGGIILIDEPEISLHPTWQVRIKEIIKKTFKGLNVQFIISTHSPYVFQNFDSLNESCIKVESGELISKSIGLGAKKTELQKSIGYISYIAYGIPSIALHIELYTLLQVQENKEAIMAMENWLKNPKNGNVKNTKTFKRTKKYKKEKIGTKVTETLPTYIRNSSNHGDEKARIYTQKNLEDSTKIMLKLLN